MVMVRFLSWVVRAGLLASAPPADKAAASRLPTYTVMPAMAALIIIYLATMVASELLTNNAAAALLLRRRPCR